MSIINQNVSIIQILINIFSKIEVEYDIKEIEKNNKNEGEFMILQIE